MWAAGIIADPRLSDERVELTKAISLIYIIDDVFNIFGTLDELVLFANSVSSVADKIRVATDHHLCCSSGLLAGLDRGDSVSQAAAASTLKNLSAVPDVRLTLAEEGVIKVMINILNDGILLVLKNGPQPQEPAFAAIRSLVTSVPVGALISLGILPRVAHVLKPGSAAAQQVATSAIFQICVLSEVKKLIGEAGCIPWLVRLLESKSTRCCEIAAQTISSLMTVSHNHRGVKKDEKSVPSLVQLLDPSPPFGNGDMAGNRERHLDPSPPFGPVI
ncbi:hypothetical protein MLD38_037243 [Melastoma candidum]|uniref:Uncharacterized protein n=1 Tax=Melastoma candidum TaxID=119954 RepID=A0ACB9LMG4_9MYRT|nr:hypothetical protein MLD38_037243 [Melastoma candidum]